MGNGFPGVVRSLREMLAFARQAGGLMGDGAPEPVDRAGREPALLCLHGFGCVPNEVELLSTLGIELGLRTRAPLLPGHGTHARDLAATRYPDWFAAAEEQLFALTRQGPAIVGGQSMGAVLAFDLAARHPERVRGVVAYANALHLAWPFPDLPLAVLGVPLGGFALPKFGGPNIADPGARQAHLTYSSQPIAAARSLRAAGLAVEQNLGRIACPVFIAHGALDITTPPRNAWLAAERIGSLDVEVHLLPNSAHILTKDTDRATLKQRTAAFLRRVTQ